MSDTFAVRGALRVVDSAAVLCARYRPKGEPRCLTLADCGVRPGDDAGYLRGLFGDAHQIPIDANWEVLLGQAEAINWMRSTPTKLTTMRYAGEWKLAGGNVDEGESVYAAACRELSEEFLRPLGQRLPRRARVRPFVCKQTRPIRSRSNVIHTFIALEDENEWLRDFDVDEANRRLGELRERHKRMLQSGAFWGLSDAEKELVSPEVRCLRWMDLAEAVAVEMSSMAPSLICVNDYQREAFQRLGRRRRDPMFITAAAVHELDALPGPAAVRRWCAGVDLPTLSKRVQWLHTGMDDAQVRVAFAKGGPRVNPLRFIHSALAETRARRSAALVCRRGPPHPLQAHQWLHTGMDDAQVRAAIVGTRVPSINFIRSALAETSAPAPPQPRL